VEFYQLASSIMSFTPPTEEELAAVEALKNRFERENPDANYKFSTIATLRFYRGRKRVEEDTIKAMTKHLKWRETNDVDDIPNHIEKFQDELNSGKLEVKGYDTTGRPAVFIYAGKHDKNDRDILQMELLIIHTLELLLKRAKPDEERIMICFDLSGFKMSCMDYDVVKLLIGILDFNYPETLSICLIINAPFIFYACWAVIRPWLDPVTAAKVMFINANKLSEHIVDVPPTVVVDESAPKLESGLSNVEETASTSSGGVYVPPPPPISTTINGFECPTPPNPGSPVASAAAIKQFDNEFNQVPPEARKSGVEEEPAQPNCQI